MSIKKKPLYVEIYEKIYDMIIQEELKKGERLPGELELSKQFKVSRATLRQALLLLKENGLIYNKQGKGNYVLPWENKPESGLEKLIAIPRSFSKGAIKDHLLNILFEVPNSYQMKKLKMDKSTLIMSCHKTYTVNDSDTIICYSLYMVSSKYMMDLGIDLHDKETISKFVENELTQGASKSTARLVSTEAGEFLVDIMNIKLDEKLMMIEEVFYDSNGFPVALTRHSIRPEYFDFTITRSGL